MKLRASPATNQHPVKLSVLQILLMSIFFRYLNLFSNPQTVSVKTMKSHHSLTEKFCQDRISSADSLAVPPIAVHEVDTYATHLKNKKSMGPGNINSLC